MKQEIQEIEVHELSKFFKQLTCSHIWKATKEEFIEARAYDNGVSVKTFNHYATYQRCVKCDKTRIIKEGGWNLED